MVVLGIMVMYAVLGMFMDSIGGMSITLPILFPIVDGLGVNAIWFGVLVIANMELGLATPPVGFNVFNVKAAAGNLVTLEDVFRGAWPYIGAQCLNILILWLFPQISLWLPSLLQ